MPPKKRRREYWKDLKYDDVVEDSKRGLVSAKIKLAWLKLSGLGGAEKDEDSAVVLLEERAKDQNGDAMWMLGLCYEFGLGTERDPERAQTLYEQSGERRSTIGRILASRKREDRGTGMMNVYRLLLFFLTIKGLELVNELTKVLFEQF